MKGIERARIAAGMTRDAVARELKVSQQSVYNWERGNADPSASAIKALAKLFGVSADELLEEE